MKFEIHNLDQLYEFLPEQEWIILDILRNLVKDNLPQYCKEKISYNVPYFYGNKGICIIWPASIPRGGIKEGVLLGFWQGNKLEDKDDYLSKGTNKKIFYKIFIGPEDINAAAIINLLKEAIHVDQLSKN